MAEMDTGVTIFENPYNRNVLRIGYDGLDAYAYVLEDTEEVEGNLKDFAEKHNINWKVGRFW